MNSLNLSILDHRAKAALQLLLKPRLYVVIEPWLHSASEDEKRKVVKVGALLHVNKAPAVEPSAPNRFNLTRPLADPCLSLDLHETMPLGKGPGKHLTPKQRHQREALGRGGKGPGVSFQSKQDVERYYVLNYRRVSDQPFAQVLGGGARRGLSLWQEGCRDQGELALVATVLRSLHDTAARLPKYEDLMAQYPWENTLGTG